MAGDFPCPSLAVLRQLLDQNVPDAEQTRLQEHLEICPRCQQRLQELAAGNESWTGAAQYLGGEAPAGEELRRAMEKLRHKDQLLQTCGEGEEVEEIALSFLDPPAKPRQLGKLDHYEIIEIVGRGGMGLVFKALDPRLHRIIAVKVMAPQFAALPSARQRFLREARAAAAVCHEHVVTIHAVSEAKGLPYLVMQYVSGVSLQERLERRGPLNLDEILRIGMQTAQGLSAAHAQGLVHRDIKPANILLENGVERVKITDFGLARAGGDAHITQSGVIVGTPQYMAPEQARGQSVDHRADLFSLGSVLYFMCTGQPPFQGNSSLAVLRQVCDDAPPPIMEINPNTPNWLVEIIARLQAKEPGDRYSSAREVADLLNQHLSRLQRGGSAPTDLTPPMATVFVPEALPVAVPEWLPPEPRQHPWKKRLALMAAMVLLASLGLSAYLLLWRSPRQHTPEPVGPVPKVEEREPERNDKKAPFVIPAPQLTASKVEVRLTEPFAQVRTGGDGRYLVFHLKKARKLAVFDVAAVKVIEEIELPTEDVVYACGRDKLLIVLPGQRLIQRRSLRTLALEKTVPVPDDGLVRRVVMGCSSQGPLLLWSGGKISFYDVESMKPFAVEGQTVAGGMPWGLELRASADGQTIVAWTPNLGPMNYRAMHLSERKASVLLSPDGQSFNGHWAMPNADGSLIFRHAAGIYTGSMKALTEGKDGNTVLLPTEDARFFLRLRKQTKDKDQVDICTTADRRTLWNVPNLERMTSSRIYTQWGVVAGEPRLHYLPSAQVLLALPESNDRIVIRSLNLFDLLERDGKNYLFVLSAPRTRVRSGALYDYSLDIRSKSGGVRCKLAAGPEGMTVSTDGRLRWQAPADQEGKTANVIVNIRDSSEKEIQHSFEIVVE